MSSEALLVYGAAIVVVAAGIAWVSRAYWRSGGRRLGPLAAIAGLAGGAVLGLYVLKGSPDLPAAPYAPRIADIRARVNAGGPEAVAAEELLALLNKASADNPAQSEPRVLAGLIQLQGNDLRGAARSFEAALRRDPNNARAALELARISAAMNGPAHQGTQQLFARAAMLNPDDPVPWIYKGLAATQEGRREDAIAAWKGALQRFGAEDPRRQMAQQMLAAALKSPREEARSPS